MKKILKTSLVAVSFAAFAFPANAESETRATNMFILEVGQSVIQETQTNVDTSRLPREVFVQKLMAKLRARINEFKTAYKTDCISAHGKDRSSECQCVVRKTDFGKIFAWIEKQFIDINEQEKIQKQIEDQKNEIEKSCGL